MAGPQNRTRGRTRGRWLLLVVLVAAASIPLSCTLEERYAVLCFFFDDVPDPFAEPDPRGMGSADATADEEERRSKPLVFHAPYRDKECSRCHPPGRYVARRGTRGPRFCFGCHEEVQQRFASYRFVHGPAAVYACLDCHAPHQSPHPGLAIAPDPQLCYRCHDRETVLAIPNHPETGEEACLGCHDPHGGTSRFFLRRDSRS